MQRLWVQSLVTELRSHTCPVVHSKKRRKFKKIIIKEMYATVVSGHNGYRDKEKGYNVAGGLF